MKAKLKAIDPSDGDVVDKMVDAIDEYIKGASITVAAGIPVSTAGSAAAQTGATTAPGTGTIS
ncbi:MAG: hypothetical protein J5708_05680 [Bacteroidales bacterium]|nr:hypothetical protein [Bacteroidales bacterium]